MTSSKRTNSDLEARIAQPLIINLAPTGIVPTRARSPSAPLQPYEIIRDVLDAAAIGITIAHLHARDENDEPTHRRDIYARIIAGIRERRSDIVICVSCSGRAGRDAASRAEVLDLKGDLKPDMASLTLSSFNFPSGTSLNAPETIKYLAHRMLDADIKPEFEIFDLGMANMISYLHARGQVKPPFYANLLFGNFATAQADFLEIGATISRLPSGTIWSIAGLGAVQLPIAAMGVAAAPGVRIGLEDNLWLDANRSQLATNLQLVESVHRLLQPLGRTVMAPNQLRNILELPGY